MSNAVTDVRAFAAVDETDDGAGHIALEDLTSPGLAGDEELVAHPGRYGAGGRPVRPEISPFSVQRTVAVIFGVSRYSPSWAPRPEVCAPEEASGCPKDSTGGAL